MTVAQFSITITASYRCKDQRGRFTPSQTLTLPLIVEGDSPDSDYSSEIEAEIAENEPEGCYAPGTYSYSIAEIPSGGDITVYAVARFDCGQQGPASRTIRVDVPITSTRDDVLDDVRSAIADMEVSSGGVYACDYAGFEVVSPLMYSYSGL